MVETCKNPFKAESLGEEGQVLMTYRSHKTSKSGRKAVLPLLLLL